MCVCICYCCWPERAAVSVPRYSLSGIFKYSRPVSPTAIPPLPPLTPPSPNRVRSPTQRPRPTFAVQRYWTRVYVCIFLFSSLSTETTKLQLPDTCFFGIVKIFCLLYSDCTHTHTRARAYTALAPLFGIGGGIRTFIGRKISLTKKKNSLKIATTRRETRLVPCSLSVA